MSFDTKEPLSPHERFDRVLAMIGPSAGPFIEEAMRAVYGTSWQDEARRVAYQSMPAAAPVSGPPRWEPVTAFNVMLRTWERVFKPRLDGRVRAHVFELQKYCHEWAHQKLDPDDVDRAIDTARRLFVAIGAKDAAAAASKLSNGFVGPEPARHPATVVAPSANRITKSNKRSWTDAGSENDNGQRNEGPLEISGNHPNQRAYRMTCLGCQHQYASNGCDIHIRRCPRCQGGASSAGGWSPRM